MKRLLAILLCFVMLLSFAACGKDEVTSTNPSTETPTTPPTQAPTTCSHSWKDATCTTPKTCSKCGATDGSAAGHSWNEATYTAPKTCSICHITEGSPLTREIQEIIITSDNWMEYFEIADSVIWDYNDFNEIDGMWLRKVIKLKSNYYGMIAKDTIIAFEASGIIMDKLLVTDYPNKQYSVQPKTWSGGLGEGISHTETTSLYLYEEKQTDEASIYSCHDGYYIIDNEKVIIIDVLEQVEVTRAQGVLYLYIE